LAEIKREKKKEKGIERGGKRWGKELKGERGYFIRVSYRGKGEVGTWTLWPGKGAGLSGSG